MLRMFLGHVVPAADGRVFDVFVRAQGAARAVEEDADMDEDVRQRLEIISRNARLPVDGRQREVS